MTASVLHLPRPVSPGCRAIVESQVTLAAAYGVTPDTPLGQAAVDASVREVGLVLMAEVGHSVDPHEIHDAFVAALDATVRLHELDSNPEEFLASLRLNRTVEERLRVEADLRSERDAAMQRLYRLGGAR